MCLLLQQINLLTLINLVERTEEKHNIESNINVDRGRLTLSNFIIIDQVEMVENILY